MNESISPSLVEQVKAALAHVPGINFDPQAWAGHLMRPDNVATAAGFQGPVEQFLHVMRPPSSPMMHPVLNVDPFIADIENMMLRSNVAGYALGLNENGLAIRRAQWGYAIEPHPGEAWTPDTRSHVASISKNITAMAMTKALIEKNIPFDAIIITYLPDYWDKGPNIDQITFDKLLTHKSGLNYNLPNFQSEYAFMKQQIGLGTSHIGQFSYQNINYGLCRILLSSIYGTTPGNDLGSFQDTLWDLVTMLFYEDYVVTNIFRPAGVSGPTLQHESGDALAYTSPVTGTGWNSNDIREGAGADGWHMTVDQVLAAMGTFRRTNEIVTTTQAQSMLDRAWGIDFQVDTHYPQLGQLYAKIGYWYNTVETPRPAEQGVAFYLPQDMELVVLVN